jgi:hypothetical protein
MINFFRKIRQQFFMQDQTGKSALPAGRYLKYALGEILLVVIGILIALQINNWNELRKLKQQEQLLLVEINNEFKYNKIELESTLLYYNVVRVNLEKIIDLFPIDIQQVNIDSLSVWLEASNFSGTYDYSNTSLDKIRNSDSYELISNIELRNLLLQWETILEDYMERELYSIDHYQNTYIPFFNTRISWPYDIGFKDPRTNTEFLGTIEFENIIKYRNVRVNMIFSLVDPERTNNIIKTIDRIIELSKINN